VLIETDDDDDKNNAFADQSIHHRGQDDQVAPVPKRRENVPRRARNLILITFQITNPANYLRDDLITPNVRNVLSNVTGPLVFLTAFERDGGNGTLTVLATSEVEDVLVAWTAPGEWNTIGRAFCRTMRIIDVVRVSSSSCKTIMDAQLSLGRIKPSTSPS